MLIRFADHSRRRCLCVSMQDMQDRLNTDVAAAARSIVHSHVLTLHGTADRTIFITDGFAVTDAVKSSTMRVFEGADHGFSKHGPQVIATVVEHVQQHVESFV